MQAFRFEGAVGCRNPIPSTTARCGPVRKFICNSFLQQKYGFKRGININPCNRIRDKRKHTVELAVANTEGEGEVLLLPVKYSCLTVGIRS